MQLTPIAYQYNIESLTHSGQSEQILSALLVVLGLVLIFILPKLYIWNDARIITKNKIKQRATI